MKKATTLIPLLAAITLSIISCRKISVSDELSILPDEIHFADGRIAIDTKAFTEATDSTLQANGFNVAAIIDNGNTTMFYKAVTYNNGTYSVPGEHYFFPAEGTMSFYAVYPKTQSITMTYGMATLSYNQNADTDLIAARKIAVSGSSEPVELAFDHLLSQVSIKVQGNESTVDYKIRSVILTSAAGGKYAFSDGTWTPCSGTADIPVYSGDITVSAGGQTSVGTPVSVLPGNVKVRIVWECYNKGTSIIVNEKDVSVDISLEKGKNTTLNLTLPFSGTGLTFSTTVGAWLPDHSSSVKKYKPATVKSRFTVDDNGTPDNLSDDRIVKFTKGNLFWNGEEFSCEENQYDYPATRTADHIGLFFWSKDARVACAADYNNANTEFGITPAITDTFFASDGGVFEGFTTLSKSEWEYLFANALEMDSDKPKIVTVNGVSCAILKPDGFSGTVFDSYTAQQWAEAESGSGLVALPFNGGTNGYYWTGTPHAIPGYAYHVNIRSSKAGVSENYTWASEAVRLVAVQ